MQTVVIGTTRPGCSLGVFIQCCASHSSVANNHTQPFSLKMTGHTNAEEKTPLSDYVTTFDVARVASLIFGDVFHASDQSGRAGAHKDTHLHTVSNITKKNHHQIHTYIHPQGKIYGHIQQQTDKKKKAMTKQGKIHA